MAVKLEAIRAAAARVAASHGLDLVEIEFIGPAKDRILRVYLEKNAEGRAKLKAAIHDGAESLAGILSERLIQETQAGNFEVEQLSGITHEDCADFSRDFGVLLDVEDLIPGDEYTLEASSPGLDRKLTRPEDFRRFAGSLVKVQTFEPVRNNRHWQGRLTAGAGNTITLDLNAVKQSSKSRKSGAPNDRSSSLGWKKSGAPNDRSSSLGWKKTGAPNDSSSSQGGGKAGVSTVEIALANIEKAQLVPEI
jgi:ribosome maturation factor RimP